MDPKSFKQLILPHSDAMYRMAFYVTGDRDDSLDAVQESVASLWEHREALYQISDLKAYALTTAKRHAIDILRRRPGMSMTIDSLSAHPDPDADSGRQTEHADTLSRVRELMKSLTPNERQIIELRSQADCSIDEIASITGLKEDNVRQVLSRARRKLKELYKKII